MPSSTAPSSTATSPRPATHRHGRKLDVSIAEMESAAGRAFRAAGADADTARRASRELVANELDGDSAHGLLRLTELIHAIGRGELDPREKPRVERTGDRSWRIDGRRSLPCDVAHRTSRTLIEGAKNGGLASVAVCCENPLGRLASIAGPVADAGLLVLGFSRSRHDAGTVVAHNGRRGKLGSNPMVFAAPAGDAGSDHGPIVVDLTTSAASAGDVRSRVARDEPVPDGWLTDRDGNAVHHGDGLDEGKSFLMPLGGRSQGAKGFGLGLMVEILAGVLTGSRLAGGEEADECAFFVALSPGLAGRDEASVRRDVEELAEHLMDSGEGSRVEIPGWAARSLRQQRLVDGHMALPTTLWNEVLRLAEGGIQEKATPLSTEESRSEESRSELEAQRPKPVQVVVSLADFRRDHDSVPRDTPLAPPPHSGSLPTEMPAAE